MIWFIQQKFDHLCSEIHFNIILGYAFSMDRRLLHDVVS